MGYYPERGGHIRDKVKVVLDTCQIMQPEKYRPCYRRLHI